MASKQSIDIAGMTCSVFGLEDLHNRKSKPSKVACVVLMHGRTRTRADMDEYALALCARNSPANPTHLLALSFDQRNHGHRLVDDKKNQAWAEGNMTHAQDMFAVQYGTACDASLIVDVFPAFAGTQIDIWALSGVSLGGHATLLGLVRDTRWSFAAPIIGCGDFETLMKGRWEGTKKEKRPDTWVSTELKSVLKKLDPVENVDKFKGPLLFLAGGKDKLVPHTASTRFLDALRQQNGPLFELFVDEKAGHVFSKPMLERAVEFCWKNVGGAGAGGAKL